MKNYSILLTVLLGSVFTSLGQTPRNCSEILFLDPSAASGVYSIDPDGSSLLPSMNCYCDMTTDNGGWTLILNYNHLASTEPSLTIHTTSLPLLDKAVLGFDESNTEFWGHADTALTNAIPFDEVRFYGISSAHSRIIDFKSSHTGTISYFKTGFGSTDGISSNFSAFNDHSSFLPASIDMSVSDKGNYAMTDYPLWTGSAYHWFLAGIDGSCGYQRWEVDDFPCTEVPSTLHQIWVRQNNGLGLDDAGMNNQQMKLWPNPAHEILNLDIYDREEAESTINIYNSTGQLVHSESLFENNKQLDISNFNNGFYFLMITSERGVYNQKFTIQKE